MRTGAARGLPAALLAAVVGVGCAGSGRTPAMVYYTLAVPGAPDRTLPGPVEEGAFTADPAYATPRLAYRTSPYRIEYYVFHRWAAGSPQAAVATAVGDYLSRAAGPADGPRTRIGGTIRRIEEVDEATGRLGVLAIDFRVERNGKPWLERSYQESEPADADTPEAVVAALSRALGRMLDRLLSDLLAAPPPGAAVAPVGARSVCRSSGGVLAPAWPRPGRYPRHAWGGTPASERGRGGRMQVSLSVRHPVLGLSLAVILGLAAGCSRSTQDAENRGLVVDREVAVPESSKELRETKAERRDQSEESLERAEQKRFDQLEDKAEGPPPSPAP